VRLDCNRGTGIWKSARRNQIEFRPLAITRTMCPAGSLGNQIARQLMNVRSCLLKDGHLFMPLMANRGVYEFDPISLRRVASGQVKGTATTGYDPAESLENTYRKLTYLGDAPIDADSVQKQPGLVLNPESHRLSGSGGCNRVMGGHELNGDQIIFSQVAGTMMTCLKGMETERSFLEALQRTNAGGSTDENWFCLALTVNLLPVLTLSTCRKKQRWQCWDRANERFTDKPTTLFREPMTATHGCCDCDQRPRERPPRPTGRRLQGI